MIIRHTQVLWGDILWLYFNLKLKETGNSYVKNDHDYLTAGKLDGIIC